MSEICTTCGHRVASKDWAYVYGKRRRGARLRTGELDDRPLGVDEVNLCATCARSVFVRNLRDTIVGHPVEALLAGIGVVGTLAGASYLAPSAQLWAWSTLAVGLFWVFFNWATRRPRAMCQALFRRRRKELAALHGLTERDIEFYRVAA